MNFNLKIEEINYIKFSYKNNYEEEIKDFRAIVKNYNDRELVAYAKNQDSLKAKVPQETSLYFVCNNGIYETDFFKCVAVVYTGRHKNIGILFPFGKMDGHCKTSICAVTFGGQGNHAVSVLRRTVVGLKCYIVIHTDENALFHFLR